MVDGGPPPEDGGPPPEDGGGDLCAGVDCSDLADDCNDAACDPATGACVQTPRADGTSCAASGGCIAGGSCAAGVCEGTPVADGTACDDGDACTTSEVCAAGACGGGAAVDCSGMSDACNLGVCDRASGACVATPVTDGTGCDDGDRCTSGDVCSAGTCGGAAMDCSGMSDACNTGTCDGATGACVAMPVMDGTGCDDGSLCTSGDVCRAGACGGAAVDCSGMTSGCAVGACNPATGMCMAVPAMDGTGCDDGDRCTTADVCSAGACGGAPMDCSAMSDACNVGTCNAITGACVATPVMDGTGCDDGDLCTTGDACGGGSCLGGAAVDCSGMGTACAPAMCDGATGACVLGTPSAICSACPGGYCAADGSCQASVSSIVYDFEAGLPSGWTTTGSASWFASTTMPHGGAQAAESGNISDSQQTSLIAPFNFPTATSVSFWYRTSTESGYDFLRLVVDGVVVTSWSGTNAWTQYSFTLSAGAHTVEWRYTKDASLSSGSDTVWVDDVTVTSYVTTTVGDFTFEGSTSLPAGLTTSGSAGWTVSTTTAHAGTNSGRSGAITHSQTTTLSYPFTLTGPGTLSFWYSVSSETSYDYLRFYLDGVQIAQWSGTVAWAQRTQAVSTGSHTAEWRYIKDGSVSSGSDAAWVDDILLTEAGPGTANLCGP